MPAILAAGSWKKEGYMLNYKETAYIASPDFRPSWECFLTEVLNGLQKPQKELPSKYFYNEKGSHLFESICALDEYYIPRIEEAIMDTCVDEIADLLETRVLLVEYGSGNCKKTHALLEHLHDPIAYVPIDISQEQLLRAARELSLSYPKLEVLPVCADYTNEFELPVPKRGFKRAVVYFPGSTIGNFDPVHARRFLKRTAGVCGLGGALLIGVDLKKDTAILHRAYNDSQGVTAAFNLNLLERINNELGGDFNPNYFEHKAFYNPNEGRMEMHMVSLRRQIVNVGDKTIHFTEGESIWTESSYKFTLDEFANIAVAAGFAIERVWTDEKQWFSVHYLVAKECPTL